MERRDFPVITICGSMRYMPTMLLAAESLTNAGYIVLAPFNADFFGGKDPDAKKRMLDEMHLAKIDMASVIIVIGPHRGESTTKEIAYAREHGKLVFESVPDAIRFIRCGKAA